jgi:hypothetical protein
MPEQNSTLCAFLECDLDRVGAERAQRREAGYENPHHYSPGT